MDILLKSLVRSTVAITGCTFIRNLNDRLAANRVLGRKLSGTVSINLIDHVEAGYFTLENDTFSENVCGRTGTPWNESSGVNRTWSRCHASSGTGV